MTRYVLSPHIDGWGHRVRVDSIARRLSQVESSSEITMLVRSDDPIDPSSWTQFPIASSTVARTWSICTADVLVQDGAWKQDIRVRAMQVRGGRLFLIGQPYGLEMLPDSLEKVLAAAENIIIPWPSRLFKAEGVFADCGDKVTNVEPVLNLASLLRETVEDWVVFLSISRTSAQLSSMVRSCIARISQNIQNAIQVAGGQEQVLPRERYSRLFASARLVISQGTTAVFEAMAVGIPVLMLPLKENQEQERLALDLERQRAGVAIHHTQLTEVNLERAIETLLADETYRGQLVQNAHRLVPRSGLEDVVNLIRAPQDSQP